jgi:hypothetical protein
LLESYQLLFQFIFFDWTNRRCFLNFLNLVFFHEDPATVKNNRNVITMIF